MDHLKVSVMHRGVSFDCRADQKGWKCGRCKAQTLGMSPEEGTPCSACGAVVHHAIEHNPKPKEILESGIV